MVQLEVDTFPRNIAHFERKLTISPIKSVIQILHKQIHPKSCIFKAPNDIRTDQNKNDMVSLRMYVRITIRVRMAVFGLSSICGVFIGIRLQLWIQVIVNVDLYVRLLLEM
jgi:hypothetical protein